MTDARPPMQKCPCGCGEFPMPGRRYADYERCRQRAYRQRVRAAAEAKGIPAVASLRTLETAAPTASRSGYGETRRTAGQARRRREGLSVYFPCLDDAEEALWCVALVDSTSRAQDFAGARAALEKAIDRRKAR